MTGNIPLSSNGRTGEETVIEDVEDVRDEVRDKIDNGKDGVLPSSKFVDLIETLVEGFHSEELAGHLRKLDPNESGSLDRFAFVRWYVDEEVSLDSAKEAELLVGWD